ncbi:MAG: peptidoglycan DD-metalloendopeptidase family protein [Coriobacteriia bacterium]|nr:peptidoglycan DD-metalloendopeptidase family protein [Coriobacteriia bacterium]
MKSVLAVLCAVSLVWIVAGGRPAWAAEWSPPVDGGGIMLPFGATYPGGVHRGVDLPAGAGAEVRAPSAGTITFAGTVPADGGGTCNAVTLETTDGQKISLLPLEGVYVRAGAAVFPGDPVGRLAAAGDDSSSAPHLHLSLREGDRYIDPTPMLPHGGVEDSGATTGVVVDPLEPADAAALEVVKTASAPLPATAPTSVTRPAPSQVGPSVHAEPVVQPHAPSDAATAVDSATAEPACAGASSPAGAAIRAGDAALSGSSPLATARLIADAGVTVSLAQGPRTADAGAGSGVTRWVSRSRRGGVPTSAARTPVTHALTALVVVMNGAIAFIARSKALVRVR